MRATALGNRANTSKLNSQLTLYSARFYLQVSAAQDFTPSEAYLFAVTGRKQRFWRQGIKKKCTPRFRRVRGFHRV